MLAFYKLSSLGSRQTLACLHLSDKKESSPRNRALSVRPPTTLCKQLLGRHHHLGQVDTALEQTEDREHGINRRQSNNALSQD